MAGESQRRRVRAPPPARRITVVLVPPVDELDLVGPLQVFHSVNRLAGRTIYTVDVVTSSERLAVEGESGVLTFMAKTHFKKVVGQCDSVLLVCGLGSRSVRDAALSTWLKGIWVAEHLQSKLSVEDLAHRMAMSVRNFERVFTREVGTTPSQYVLHMRVEAARRRLERTSDRLKQVAAASGFSSELPMRRAFVRVRLLGITPGRYRELANRSLPSD